MEPRYYQESAIPKLKESLLAGNKRPIMVLPTGGGKSLIFGQIISNAIDKGNTILWIVHRRNLVFQMRDVLKDHFDIDAGIIMSGIDSDTEKPVQLSTIQTYGRRIKKGFFASDKFFVDADLILIDEGHRSLAKTYRDVIDLYENKIVMACTATPMRLDGRGMGEVYDSIVNIAGVKELVDAGYLSPMRYFAPVQLDLEGVRTAMGDYVVKDLDGKVNKTKLIGDIVENWLKIAEGRKTIVFTVNVKHSKAICAEFNRVGVAAEHLDARSTDEERDLVFAKMECGEIDVICNVALYQEGLDVPQTSCIVFARPTKSLGLLRQCGGRGMRIAKGKKDCIFLDHGNALEEHGLLDWEIEWTLDGKKKAWSKARQEDTESLVKCRACHKVFQGSKVCPDCGTEVKSFGKKILTVEAELEEINAKEKDKFSNADKRRWYGMFKMQCKTKGYAPGWIAHKYKEKFKVWPKNMKDVTPIEPDITFKNWMKYQNIKWVKSKNNKKAKEGLNRGSELIEKYKEDKHAGLQPSQS